MLFVQFYVFAYRLSGDVIGDTEDGAATTLEDGRDVRTIEPALSFILTAVVLTLDDAGALFFRFLRNDRGGRDIASKLKPGFSGRTG